MKNRIAGSVALATAIIVASASLAGASVQHEITVGNSKSNCIYVDSNGGSFGTQNFRLAQMAMKVTASCAETFDNPMQTWQQWENPWQFTDPSWVQWINSGKYNQIVLGQDLVPWSATGTSTAPVPNPLTWETEGAKGDFNSYAKTLSQNLLREGVFKSGKPLVIRLGIEANGNWEADYIGSTAQEGKLWAATYDNEVSAMRSVPGTHYLFVWNPNISYSSGIVSLSQWYPGNKYVDIMGADIYDQDSANGLPVSKEGWGKFASDGLTSLNSFRTFATTNDKPIAFPEWGLVNGVSGDDPSYIAGMASIFRNVPTAFQSYFDCNCDSITPMNSSVPNSLKEFIKEFQTP